MMTPIIFMFSASFKYNDQIYDLALFSSDFTLDNYIYIIENTDFIIWLLNSLFVSLFTTFCVLFFDSLVGYTLAKFKFNGQKIVFIAILSTLMIPTEMLVIPWYIIAQNFGLLDSYLGLILPGIMTGFGVFLMKQFFEGVPDDYLEAARIDGVGEFTIFIRIALPLVTPALSALAIFTFLGNWTAFLWPLIVSSSAEIFTVPVGLASFSGEFQSDWELIMTGAALATLPTLLVFLILQRYIIRGVVLGGLKG
ncbi:MAG: carbohydrate ABC transporter permease [Kordiimonadaceae bacterium]|nr:carbohydrate ABC transporter permease [Kordiimonadaceae bacterium]MBT6134551.1 carbohydrate ABC transporter permease [Kordiimonadaceae bacterium]MBT6467410.1 carbohydrate ABC transporter permease [Kordiimonadaceae bacterium]MBT7544905.1 carbohydrate ABC transporter permease [Kordiimonadaceae bacterium]MBT7604801.1 carbohydrate ABC transporter permease [Kordiimonadaceae bacterium]